jgi:hypothetical protein
MTFILVPKQGEDIQVNAWNWRPTLELLRVEGLITEQDYARMGAQGCGGQVDAVLACRIADVVENRLLAMKPGERMRADLTVTAMPKVQQIFTPDPKPNEFDATDLYSATYEWLATFKNFCRGSDGFEVY